jgi:ribosomal protein S18 acetylase RimI-like enzyme
MLAWDSKFFGFPIASVQSNTLASGDMDAIDIWCARNAVRCLYFLASGDDYGTARYAALADFILVDTRLRYVRTPQSGAGARAKVEQARCSVRRCTASDLDALCAIARVSYLQSRFYFDEHFPRERCSQLYEVWLRKSFDTSMTALFVAEHEQRLLGYISCSIDIASKTGNIGLVGVDSRARELGVGGMLVETAGEWFALHAATAITVVTQGRNIAAQRLYQRSGFLVENCQVWYHKWYGDI